MRTHGALFVFAAIVCISTAVQGDDEVTVDEIKRSLRRYQETVETLSVSYTLQRPADWHLQDMSKEVVNEAWLWLRSGKKKLLKSSNPGAPRSLVPTFLSYDGMTGYQLVYTVELTPEISGIDETPHEPKNININPIAQALGWIPLRHGATKSTMALLQEVSNELVEYESVTTADDLPSDDDERCVRLKLAEVPLSGDGDVSYELVAWLSVRHGFLPKRIARLPVLQSLPNSRGIVELPSDARPEIVDICEFTEVDDALLKTSRWFPKTIKVRGSFVYDVDVQSIALNQQIPASEFVPTPPFGAEIRIFSAGSVHPKMRYQGGEEGQRRHQEQMANLALRKSSESTQTYSQSTKAGGTVVATPPFRWTLSIRMAVASLFLLMTALFIRHRAQRQ